MATEDPIRAQVKVWLIHAYFNSPAIGPITEDWTLAGDLRLDGDSYTNIAQAFKRDVRQHPTIWPKLKGTVSGPSLEQALSDRPGRPKKTVGDLIDELRKHLAG
jgi:hypothetical protein